MTTRHRGISLPTVDTLGDLRGRRVLLRVDANVPMDHRTVRDDAKLRACIPTLRALLVRGATCVILSHLGEGKRSETLAPVARHFGALPDAPRIAFTAARIGTAELMRAIARMRAGSAIMIENLRWYRGEANNAPTFARSLAALGSAYVNDAFAVCHRAHASVALLPRLLPSAAGLLLEREVRVLDALARSPKRPYVALMGGAKISTKLGVLGQLMRRADRVLIGGALANHFLAARGYGIGASFVEPKSVHAAATLFRAHARRIVLPDDLVLAPRSGRGSPRVVAIPRAPQSLCSDAERIADIGPATITAFSEHLRRAATIVWNGPMGTFEQPPYHHGSIALARVIAERSSGRAFGVVGGGETLEVLAQTGMERYIDHVSTGGGAMLAFLAGEELPGLAALTASA